jgi:hypothetical protein
MNATLSFPGAVVADWVPDAYALDCGDSGCLWDVRADPVISTVQSVELNNYCVDHHCC